MQYDLTDRQTLSALLKERGLYPRTTAGQHFLCCREVIEATVAALDPAVRMVTELGAGVGSLTLPLLEAGWQVRAVERDEGLAQLLRELTPSAWQRRLTVVQDDLRRVAWAWGETPYQVVGNIPYNLSGYIFRRLTQLAPVRTVLLVQREVAGRLAAVPPQLTLLGLAVHLWGRAEVIRQVPRGCFWPRPHVNSTLVRLTYAPSGSVLERERVLSFARPLFARRRKQLGGSLRHVFGLTSEAAAAVLAAAGTAPQQRPQEVSVADWQHIARALQERGVIAGQQVSTAF